jgi:Fe-S oxidoreductase
MDFLLFFILTGLIIAIAKRFYSRITGLKKITKHATPDRLALTFLWLIFPLRLLAESATASFAGNGSFLTQPVGDFLADFIPTQKLHLLFWWMYSSVLGAFLISVPFSRYMHIPTEVLLIFLRNYGVKTKEEYSGFSELEVQSCSRCGICIDSCQMNGQPKSGTAQMVYFLRNVRYHQNQPELTNNCLMCGRCNEVCPVGIDLTQQRLLQRKKDSGILPFNFSYLKESKPPHHDVLYFAGCMSHLTPSVIHSMITIFKAARLNYTFMDEKGGICCGRPLKLSGQIEASRTLMEHNRKQILDSGAKILVTSCPICYKSFKEDYNLPIRVVHHSEFIPEIIRKRKLVMKSHGERIVYHDPCELGRGSGIYEQPRLLLKRFSSLIGIANEKEKSLCCGGSLGNLSVRSEEREKIQKTTAEILMQANPDCIATACPMCKRSIGQFTNKPVKDIAELVSANLDTERTIYKPKKQEDTIPELSEILY